MINKKKTHFSDEELADAYIFPNDLSPEDKAAADTELRVLRMQRLRQMTDQQRLLADLLRLKFEMEDYVRLGVYTEQHSFGAYLQRYLKLLDLKQHQFAQEIGLHPTKVNQLIKGRVEANIGLTFRLEKHTGGIIPATLWWKLIARKIEDAIAKDKATRAKEEQKVHHARSFEP